MNRKAKKEQKNSGIDKKLKWKNKNRPSSKHFMHPKEETNNSSNHQDSSVCRTSLRECCEPNNHAMRCTTHYDDGQTYLPCPEHRTRVWRMHGRIDLRWSASIEKRSTLNGWHCCASLSKITLEEEIYLITRCGIAIDEVCDVARDLHFILFPFVLQIDDTSLHSLCYFSHHDVVIPLVSALGKQIFHRFLGSFRKERSLINFPFRFKNVGKDSSNEYKLTRYFYIWLWLAASWVGGGAPEWKLHVMRQRSRTTEWIKKEIDPLSPQVDVSSSEARKFNRTCRLKNGQIRTILWRKTRQHEYWKSATDPLLPGRVAGADENFGRKFFTYSFWK